MKILTTRTERGDSVSFNCDQIMYVIEDGDKCRVVMAAGDLLTVEMPYLEVIGFLKADY